MLFEDLSSEYNRNVGFILFYNIFVCNVHVCSLGLYFEHTL